MPLIEREKKETFRTIPIKLEEGLAERFLAYAEFLESSKDHIVSAALTYIMGHDKDFTAHLTANGALPGKPGSAPQDRQRDERQRQSRELKRL